MSKKETKMQPIRVQEKDYWREEIRTNFYNKTSEVQNIYNKQLNEKVKKSYPKFKESIGVDKLIVALERQIKEYQNFKDTYKSTLKNHWETMVNTAQKIESTCAGFVEASANTEPNTLNLSDVRADEHVELGRFDNWAFALCSSWAEQDDIRNGNPLKQYLDGLDQLKNMAYSRLEEGYSLADAKDEIYKIYLKAEIRVPTLPEHVNLPTLLEHDSQ
ncbi:MAG TPA: hypothetical protein DCM10_07565 [Xanthomarina gelatinilytica]|nr:hypothetical protein [Xanthomarina gelatinilytica]|tara:strand:+ start:121 stop:771 length:651 start_codon:yes stop_codon:yes gene_type:complete